MAFLTLDSYRVLAASGINTTNQTTITYGYYGSYPVLSYTGTFIGTENNNNSEQAQRQLYDLIQHINETLIPNMASVPLSTSITNNITFYPNTNYYSTTEIHFQGINITLDCQNLTSATFVISAEHKIRFEDIISISLINITNLVNLDIYWLTDRDIEFKGTLPPNIPGTFIAWNNIGFEKSANISGKLYCMEGSISFTNISRVDPLPSNFIVCYAKGTLILTEEGFVPIENIKAGHKVVTKGKIYKNEYVKNDANIKIEPVQWISKFKVIDLNSNSRPICIEKDALGENCPFKDLYVSPGHSLLLNDKMVLAKNLVNDKTIYQDKECDDVEYYHLECENHSAIYANGVLAESYREANNRDVFENSI